METSAVLKHSALAWTSAVKILSQLLREDDLKDFLLYTKEVWLDVLYRTLLQLGLSGCRRVIVYPDKEGRNGILQLSVLS